MTQSSFETFSDLKLHPSILRGVTDAGYSEPTPIQKAAIPPGLDGRDVIACATTGSGKTAAFLLPILDQLIDEKRGKTRALIVTPTRELCAQIQEQAIILGRHTGIESVAVYGGVGMGPQERALRKKVDIVVATPGRLLDHVERGTARFDDLEILVLDEADRMLDMGFLPDVKRILRLLPRDRQTLFFSATMPPPIAALTREMLKDPVSIDVARRAEPAQSVTQSVYAIRGDQKTSLLLKLLAEPGLERVLVFTRTKRRANRVAEQLVDARVGAARIHGNRSQSQRELALDGFKSGKVRVLVATDIASRGIDVTNVTHVINYDVPYVPEDYIHRVGRTGRASALGDAITMVSPEEESVFRQIEKAIGKKLPRQRHEGMKAEAGHHTRGPINRDPEDREDDERRAPTTAPRHGHAPAAHGPRRTPGHHGPAQHGGTPRHHGHGAGHGRPAAAHGGERRHAASHDGRGAHSSHRTERSSGASHGSHHASTPHRGPASSTRTHGSSHAPRGSGRPSHGKSHGRNSSSGRNHGSR